MGMPSGKGRKLNTNFTIAGVRDYCLEEGFSAECRDNSVVVITSALYGRMTVGRCVSRNYGYIGCRADILKHVAKLCSGKRSCGINNFATSFAEYRVCPADLKGYMEVSFECVPGELFLLFISCIPLIYSVRG